VVRGGGARPGEPKPHGVYLDEIVYDGVASGALNLHCRSPSQVAQQASTDVVPLQVVVITGSSEQQAVLGSQGGDEPRDLVLRDQIGNRCVEYHAVGHVPPHSVAGDLVVASAVELNPNDATHEDAVGDRAARGRLQVQRDPPHRGIRHQGRATDGDSGNPHVIRRHQNALVAEGIVLVDPDCVPIVPPQLKGLVDGHGLDILAGQDAHRAPGKHRVDSLLHRGKAPDPPAGGGAGEIVVHHHQIPTLGGAGDLPPRSSTDSLRKPGDGKSQKRRRRQ